MPPLCFLAFSFLIFCLTPEPVTPTEAITGQLAGRQGGSNGLTLAGLITLRITVVELREKRGIGGGIGDEEPWGREGGLYWMEDEMEGTEWREV